MLLALMVPVIGLPVTVAGVAAAMLGLV